MKSHSRRSMLFTGISALVALLVPTRMPQKVSASADRLKFRIDGSKTISFVFSRPAAVLDEGFPSQALSWYDRGKYLRLLETCKVRWVETRLEDGKYVLDLMFRDVASMRKFLHATRVSPVADSAVRRSQGIFVETYFRV